MELSRRGVLGGIGSAFAIGAIGFAGATTVTDEGSLSTDAGSAPGVGPDGDGAGGSGEADSVAVDSSAPFEATLLADGDDAGTLFDAADLSRVQGVISEEREHLVYVALSETGIGAVQDRLAEAGATDEPNRFVVSMNLDGTEVRRVELDESRVTALTDDEWGGVLTLPFGQEPVAVEVYESLASE
ncbi:hypothetical protein EXE53_21935 [Halorubrum sp. SD626R]|uniref:hypothetical protein n=1 Tax=Halorubrum sp. SD626R TaxID=1419722 RepID=UPI0010F64E47|nr:hypothetical protein [Halorubrum sp. SD626R]TKX78302.1 hypothetical protein EXE53_21935 [Halorubrum sp. SD626R]